MSEMLYCPVCEQEKPYSHSGEITLQICMSCAERIANQFYHAICGRYVTWQQPTIAAYKDPVTVADRWAVFKRDCYRCVKCTSEIDLTIDHITPKSAGGSHCLANYQTLCRKCNSRKGGKK